MIKKNVSKVLVAALALLISPMLAPSANAHASVQLYGSEAVAGGYGHVFIRIPHASATTSTVKVEVEIPAGVTGVKPQQIGGWKESRTMSADGKDVVAVSWSEGNLPDTSFQDFGISVKFPATAGTIYFKTVQTLSDGSTVAWISIPATGQDSHSLPTPAPSLAVKAKAPVTPHGTTPEAPHGTTTETPHNTTMQPANETFTVVKSGTSYKLSFKSMQGDARYKVVLVAKNQQIASGKLVAGTLNRTLTLKQKIATNAQVALYVDGKEVAKTTIK